MASSRPLLSRTYSHACEAEAALSVMVGGKKTHSDLYFNMIQNSVLAQPLLVHFNDWRQKLKNKATENTLTFDLRYIFLQISTFVSMLTDESTQAISMLHTSVVWEMHVMGYFNVSPIYQLSTSTISKSLLESTRFNQRISMQTGSTACYSAFISASVPQSLAPPLPPAATMASLYLGWLAHQHSVSRGYVCDSKHVHMSVRQRWLVWQCLNQCLGWRIPARALHHELAHQVKPFWFWRAPSLSAFLSSHHPGVCQALP